MGLLKNDSTVALGAAMLFGLAACGAVPAPARDVVEGALVLADIDGKTHDLDAVLASGRHAALVFWQTWCPTCLDEAPDLASAEKEYGARIAFFGVVSGPDDLVEQDDILSIGVRVGTGYPQIRDRDGSLARRFGVHRTPTVVVIAPDRSVTFRGHRSPGDWSRYAAPVQGGS